MPLSFRDGWGYCYAGARATHGFTSGKVWYEVKVLENLEVRVEKDPTSFDVRVGWSTDDSGMMLGKFELTEAPSSLLRRFISFLIQTV